MAEMLPSNVDDPQFGEPAPEPLLARAVDGVADHSEDMLPAGVIWGELAVEFVGRVLEGLASGLLHH